jgi:acyl carrier protein
MSIVAPGTPEDDDAPGPGKARRPRAPQAAKLDETENMTRSASPSVEDGVITVLKRMSRRPIEPTLDSDLVTDLGFDSLQILEVIAELEDRFDISIPLNDVPATRTVAQVVAQVTALVERRAAV